MITRARKARRNYSTHLHLRIRLYFSPQDTKSAKAPFARTHMHGAVSGGECSVTGASDAVTAIDAVGGRASSPAAFASSTMLRVNHSREFLDETRANSVIPARLARTPALLLRFIKRGWGRPTRGCLCFYSALRAHAGCSRTSTPSLVARKSLLGLDNAK